MSPNRKWTPRLSTDHHPQNNLDLDFRNLQLTHSDCSASRFRNNDLFYRHSKVLSRFNISRSREADSWIQSLQIASRGSFFRCPGKRWHAPQTPEGTPICKKKKSVYTVLSTQLFSNTALCSNERIAETKEKGKKNVLQASCTIQITQQRTAKFEDICQYFSVHIKDFNITVIIPMMTKKGVITYFSEKPA
jgi:hypothetical protein